MTIPEEKSIRSVGSRQNSGLGVASIGESESFPTMKGLLQECCVSSTLFNLLISFDLKKWKQKCVNVGVQINNPFLYTSLFADDQVIIVAARENEAWGLKMKIRKTEYSAVGESQLEKI